MKLAVLLSILPAALAFMDTGVFYSSEEHSSPAVVQDLNYISHTNTLSRLACENNEKLVVHRVYNLSPKSLQKQVDEKRGKSPQYFAKYVKYESPDSVDLALSTACRIGQVKYVKYEDNSSSTSIGDEAVLVIDYADASDFKLPEGHHESSKYVIQGLPTFKKPESRLEGLKHYVEDKVSENFHVDFDFDDISKRDADDELEKYDDEEFNHLVEEVEEDFRAAESYIMKEGQDLPVTIMDSDAEPKASSTATASSYPNNLFTNYEFFTPGILSCLLVSGLLVGILYTALSWMTSLEISYKSFDKQIDFEKKTE